MQNKIRKNHTLLLLPLLALFAYSPAHAMEKKHRAHEKRHRHHKKKPHATIPSLQVLAARACLQSFDATMRTGEIQEDEYAQHVVKTVPSEMVEKLLHTPCDEPPLVKQKSWEINDSYRVGISDNFAAAANCQLVRIFSPDTGNQSSGALTLPKTDNSKYPPTIKRAVFSPCGRWLAALLKEQPHVYLWNIGSGKLTTLSVPDENKRQDCEIGLVFSPSGTRLAYAFSHTDITGEYPSYKYCDSCWFNIWETDQSKPPHTFRHDLHGVKNYFAFGKIFFTNELTLAHFESRYSRSLAYLENRFPRRWSKKTSKTEPAYINLIDVQTGRQKSVLQLRIDTRNLVDSLKFVQAPDTPHILASLLSSGVLLCDTRKSSPVQFSLQKRPPNAPARFPVPMQIAFGSGARHLVVNESNILNISLSLYALSADFAKATLLWRISPGNKIDFRRLWLTNNCLWSVDRDTWPNGNKHRLLSLWKSSPEFKLRLAIARELAKQEEENTQETTA